MTKTNVRMFIELNDKTTGNQINQITIMRDAAQQLLTVVNSFVGAEAKRFAAGSGTKRMVMFEVLVDPGQLTDVAAIATALASVYNVRVFTLHATTEFTSF